MEDGIYLKIVKPSKKDEDQLCLDPLKRFKGVVLNITENAIECVNRLVQLELEKRSPSPDILEDYHLIQHYSAFLKNSVPMGKLFPIRNARFITPGNLE